MSYGKSVNFNHFTGKRNPIKNVKKKKKQKTKRQHRNKYEEFATKVKL